MNDEPAPPSKRPRDDRSVADEFAASESVSAMLLVFAAASVATAPVELFASLFGSLAWIPVAVEAAILALVAARPESRPARALATLTLGAWVAGALAANPEHPTRGLVLLVMVVAAFAALWPPQGRSVRSRNDGLVGAHALALAFGLDSWLQHPQPEPWVAIGTSAVYLAPIALGRSRRHAPASLSLLTGALALAPLSAFVLDPGLAVHALGLLAPTVWLGLLLRRREFLFPVDDPELAAPSLLDVVLEHPSRVLVLSFLAIGAGGTVLLALPVAARGEPISWLDAAFTAVSATCVTGLAVLDTPSTFGAFGQGALFLLIQVGGLGIMVFSTAAFALLGRRLSISHERAAVDLVGASGRADLSAALRSVLIVTFVTEVGGALLLFLAFTRGGDAVPMALWRAVFTSVSAFCNAGFALQSDSLVGYAEDPFVLGVVSLIIVVGGLGPAVIVALTRWRQRRERTMHARLVLATSAMLLLVPAVLILLIEWDNTLASLGWGDRISNAIFQSVTLRTAGFNSIDLAQVHGATWTLMVVVMYVGGSPGSTAGGVKTTTLAVVVLSLLAVIRGRREVEVFGRRLPMETVLRASAVATIGVLGVVVALMAIQLTQRSLPLDAALFEVTSALATVGLSTGATAALDEVGKIIIIACMFAGRVGPLTLFVFLATHVQRRAEVQRPVETIPIG